MTIKVSGKPKRKPLVKNGKQRKKTTSIITRKKS